jgi:imidazolonepropionase-like amidohydrolase
MKAIAASFAVLVATFSPLIAQSQKPIALVGGTLIDGTGAVPVRNSVVLIRGDRIERIGTLTSLPVPSAYERVSTEGMTVLPGLWDLHVHLIYGGHPNPGAWFKHAADFERVTIPASARQMLMGGVTSVRDLAAPADAIFGVKKRIASGELAGPTLYAAGPALAKMAPGLVGVRGAKLRRAACTLPGTAMTLEYLEVTGIERHPLASRIPAPLDCS